jgi:hypothetical protein
MSEDFSYHTQLFGLRLSFKLEIGYFCDRDQLL